MKKKIRPVVNSPWIAMVFLQAVGLFSGGCLVNFPAGRPGPDGVDPDHPEPPTPPKCARYVNLNVASPGDGTSWAQAVKTVQEGIAAAESAIAEHGKCEVWVAKGIYYLYVSGPTDTLSLRPKVQVFGGFGGKEIGFSQRSLSEDNLTTLSGCNNATCAQRVYHVVCGSDESVLDGFVISGGHALGDASNADGGGMYNENASPVVTNCVFESNKATRSGGAMFNKGGSPLIEKCAFLRNQATSGGGALSIVGNPSPITLTDCQFVGNKADLGGAVQVEGRLSYTTISRSSFADNGYGNNGGALHAQGGELIVDASTFLSNTARQGGAIYLDNGKLTAQNILVVGNDSELAGVLLSVGNSELSMVNATVSFNTAKVYGNGGLEIQPNNKALISSSILWGNTPKNLGLTLSATATLAYSDVQDPGFGAGPGMLQLDPKFAVSAVPKGTWEEVTYNESTHQTELKAAGSLGAASLQSLILKPSQVQPKLWLAVVKNTDRLVYVLGNFSDRIQQGATYELVDFHLQATSECIDAAEGPLAALKDLEGKDRIDAPDRPNGAGCSTSPGTPCADMGAYEYQP